MSLLSSFSTLTSSLNAAIQTATPLVGIADLGLAAHQAITQAEATGAPGPIKLAGAVQAIANSPVVSSHPTIAEALGKIDIAALVNAIVMVMNAFGALKK